ncbi:skin secretory protein xP2 [Setaria italica]|nr:skin secretory protein xP2 [Setaria italica]
MAPAHSPSMIGESPEEAPAGAPEFESASIAAPPLEDAPAMAPAFAPFGISEAPEAAPAGAPEAEALGPSSEDMAAAPSSEDYDVLEEEVLAPEGAAGSGGASTGPETEENPDKAAVSKTPAAAPGPSGDDADSGATIVPTRRSLVASVFFAAVFAVAAS